MTAPLLATTTSIPDLVVFVVSAAAILVGAIGVVSSRNPVHAALMLVLTLFGVAVLFLEQAADFLAAVQIIVYAGAIVVLFLFVIMFLGVDRLENLAAEPLRGQRPVAFLLVGLSLAGLLVLGFTAHWATGAHGVAGPPGIPATNINHLGRSVFTTYLFAFEVTAGLLVIAVVGAVVLARRPAEPAEDEDDEDGEAAGLGASAEGPLGSSAGAEGRDVTDGAPVATDAREAASSRGGTSA